MPPEDCAILNNITNQTVAELRWLLHNKQETRKEDAYTKEEVDRMNPGLKEDVGQAYFFFAGFLFIHEYVPMHRTENSAELLRNAIITTCSEKCRCQTGLSFTRGAAAVCSRALLMHRVFQQQPSPMI